MYLVQHLLGPRFGSSFGLSLLMKQIGHTFIFCVFLADRRVWSPAWDSDCNMSEWYQYPETSWSYLIRSWTAQSKHCLYYVIQDIFHVFEWPGSSRVHTGLKSTWIYRTVLKVLENKICLEKYLKNTQRPWKVLEFCHLQEDLTLVLEA